MADTPEERVRQRLLAKMIYELGFPKGLIAVERRVGERRFDIVCYTKEMAPLLLVECKAGEIGEEAARQVFGYNERVRAPFVCLANGEEARVFWYEGGRLKWVSFLPPYVELYGDAGRR